MPPAVKRLRKFQERWKRVRQSLAGTAAAASTLAAPPASTAEQETLSFGEISSGPADLNGLAAVVLPALPDLKVLKIGMQKVAAVAAACSHLPGLRI